MLGIPFYGRYWKTGDVKGGDGINLAAAESVVKKYGGKITFDKKTMSVKGSECTC